MGKVPTLACIYRISAKGLREYMLKGGFVIFDDFREGDWYNLEEQMKRVMPEVRFFDMDASHPIFHSFFEIDNLDIIPQAYVGGQPIFRAVFEGNDPSRRLQMMINYNTDVSQFWEWSGRGLRPGGGGPEERCRSPDVAVRRPGRGWRP